MARAPLPKVQEGAGVGAGGALSEAGACHAICSREGQASTKQGQALDSSAYECACVRRAKHLCTARSLARSFVRSPVRLLLLLLFWLSGELLTCLLFRLLPVLSLLCPALPCPAVARSPSVLL